MAIEQLFASFKSSPQNVRGFDPSDPDNYDYFVQAMIADSRDYEDSTLARQREEAQAYYYGFKPSLNSDGSPYDQTLYVNDPNATFGDILGHERQDANRSTFVSTDVKDAILLMLPGLIRLFGATESPVFLVPRTEAEIDTAEQATDYVNYVFWNDNDGFLNLYGAFKDAMTVRTGFIKWWTDNQSEKKRKTYLNLTEDQIGRVQAEDPTAKIVEGGKPNPQTGVVDTVTFEYEVKKPLIRIAGVPPEEMRLDRYARTFRESRIVGHERLVPLDQLVAMGYDREQCVQYIQSQSTPEFTREDQFRNPGRYGGSRVGDGVMYGEWYLKIDKDRDGIPELRRICTMGEEHDVVMDEETNRIRFAHFSVDPKSPHHRRRQHRRLTIDIQRIKTNMMRAVLDSAAESINPKTVINELIVNLDDALNDDLGAVIRTRGDPSASVMYTNTPFLGQQIMPVIEALNDVLSRRTGLTDAAKGLDPKALQSSTMIGVEAVINGAQERVELCARVLCETGFKDLFTGLYNEICEAPNQQRTIKLRGRFVPYDTSTFDASMSVEVNPNLGKGSDQVRMMALAGIKADQQAIIAQYGLSNPVCGIPELMNTMTDMLALSNIKNVGRYFKMPSEQAMQQILSQPKAPDPQAVAAQAMLEKVRSESAKAVGQQHIDTQKMMMEDAFKHEKLHTDTAVALQKLQQEGGPGQHALAMGKLAATMMKAHGDQAVQEQKMQMDAAGAQQQMDLDAQKHQHDIALAQMKAAGAHTQAMTGLASQHHLQEKQIGSQHAQGMTKTFVGALGSDADRAASQHNAAADRVVGERQASADRESSEKIARMKPKGPAK